MSYLAVQKVSIRPDRASGGFDLFFLCCLRHLTLGNQLGTSALIHSERTQKLFVSCVTAAGLLAVWLHRVAILMKATVARAV